MRYFLLASAIAGLCQCSPPQSGRADGIDPNPFELLEKQATAANRDPSRITVPVLRSAAMEKRWGKPRLLVGPKGGYALRYVNPANPSNHLTIFGSPQRFATAGGLPPAYTEIPGDSVLPVEVNQTWRSLGLAGRTVRYYISEGRIGTASPQFSTETFRLTAPDGRTASYRLRAASSGSRADGDVAGWFATAGF